MSLPVLAGLLLLGFVILLVTADYLIRGAAALARRFGLPKLLVGLTIVAFGTSAPELAVSIDAVFDGHPDVAIANIVGSNIANVLLILGVPALVFGAIGTAVPGIRRNAVAAMAATLLIIGLSWDGVLTTLDGIILFAGILAYVGWLWRDARKPDMKDPTLAELTDLDEMEGMPQAGWKTALMIGIGVIGLPIGAMMIVKGGIGIAEAAGVPPAIVGLTLFALGTSLPELAASVMSAARGHAEVAIGNVLGSNLFNILCVGGASAIIGTIPVPEQFFAVEFWVMLATTGLLALMIFLKAKLNRLVGIAMLIGYAAYIYWLGALTFGG